MAQITTLDTVSKLLKYVTITLPPFVTKSDDSYIRQFLSSILEVFKINVDQLNQMFNNTFISEAEEGDLEKLILDVSSVTRKDGETDEDYRNRFYKYVYRYNATANSIEEIVYDTLGYYPIKLTESGARTAYWGLHDLVVEDRVANSAYFYDDVNEYTAYWGRYQSQQSAENEKYFVGIIHLTERPPQEKLDELCDVIERVRKKGTKIYLQFLDNIDIILEPVVTIVEEDAFTFTWRLVPSAFSYEVQIDEDPLFGSPTTYITSSTSYNFSGLSGGVTYYTRVRYENDDGYSEWTEPVETTTSSTIGTPIATEETNVTIYGFTTNWGSASGATSYLLTVAEDLALTVPISGLNQLNVGNVVSFDINKNEAEKLLYYKQDDSGINQYYSANIDGSEETVLTNFTAGNDVIEKGTWALNGDLIYSRFVSGAWRLYKRIASEDYLSEYLLLDNLGSPLPINSTNVKSANISNKIAFVTNANASISHTYIFDLDTLVLTSIASYNITIGNLYSPSWSEDDAYVYTVFIPVGGNPNTFGVLRVRLSDLSSPTVSGYPYDSSGFLPSVYLPKEINGDLYFTYNFSSTYFTNISKRNIATNSPNTVTSILSGTQIITSDISTNVSKNKLYISKYNGSQYKIYSYDLNGANETLLIGSSDSKNYTMCDCKQHSFNFYDYPTIPLLSTLYYGIKATNGSNTSPYSNIITVNKPYISYEPRILYVKGTSTVNYQGNIYSCNIDGSDIQQHTTTSRTYYRATWLKNADIIYSRKNGSNIEKLYLLKKSENYSTEYELLNSSNLSLSDKNRGVYAMNNSNKLVYLKTNDSSYTDLYLYDINTKVETLIDSTESTYYPSFSLDDEYVYYARTQSNNINLSAIYKYSMTSSTTSLVANNVTPSYFPIADNNNIYYAYNSSGVFGDTFDRVRKRATDNSSDIDIVTGDNISYFGIGLTASKLYFSSMRSPHNTLYKLYKANLDGSSQSEVFSSSESVNYYMCDIKSVYKLNNI